MDYKYCVFIGRFQPFHNAHLAILKEALSAAENVIVAIGSINAAENIKNPWSFNEREAMIRSCLSEDENKRVTFIGIRDRFYNENAWIIDVQQRVIEASNYSDSIALIGSYKDESSYYMKLFPQWDEILAKPHQMMNATDIRNALFNVMSGDASIKSILEQCCPKPITQHLLDNYLNSERHINLREEYSFIQEYKSKWKDAPFVPTFNTVDAVCIQSGHVLVVKRKFHPGKGLWALPGGFIKSNETLQSAAIRELKEETGIKVPKEKLAAHIQEIHTFDHPSRSLRGRTITQAFCIHLPDGLLPEVKGGDDAAVAKWISLAEVIRMENKFYEDHAHIINFFTSKY